MMKKMIWGVLVVLLVAVSFAYAAANTVPVTGAGDGDAEISGYTVSNVHYVLSSGDPSTIVSVTFELNPIETGVPDPATVKITLPDASTDWYECTAGTSPTWSCTISPAVNVLEAVSLRVVAAQ